MTSVSAMDVAADTFVTNGSPPQGAPCALGRNHSSCLFEALYACSHVGCQADSVRVVLASKDPNRHIRPRMLFIPRCADRIVTNLPLRAHLNREQSLCRLLRERPICWGQGGNECCDSHGTDSALTDTGSAVGLHRQTPAICVEPPPCTRGLLGNLVRNRRWKVLPQRA